MSNKLIKHSKGDIDKVLDGVAERIGEKYGFFTQNKKKEIILFYQAIGVYSVVLSRKNVIAYLNRNFSSSVERIIELICVRFEIYERR